MLAFNRRIVGKKDEVTVACGFLYPNCELTKEEKKRGD